MPNPTISQLQFEDNGPLIDIKPFIDYIYPVGAIYMSATLIDPSVLFGGEWEQIKDTFLLCAGDTYAGGLTGGALEHAHTQVSTTSGGPSNNTSGGPSNNTSGGPSNNTSAGPSNNTSGSTAISVSQMPNHGHRTTWSGGSSNGVGWYFNYASGTSHWSNSAAAGSSGLETTGGNGGHTHTLSSHTHSLQSHTHSLQSHTHSLQSHTHTTSATTTGNASSLPPYLTVYVWQRVA